MQDVQVMYDTSYNTCKVIVATECKGQMKWLTDSIGGLSIFQDDIDRLRHREPLLSLSSEPSSPEENKAKEKQGAVKFGWIKGVLVS